MQNDASGQAIFLQQWQTYRKIVGCNYMFHREVYGHLRRILLGQPSQRFRFLDLACGDASASAGALKGTNVSHYFGVDISKPALDLAAEELKDIGCPVTLQQSDFVDALRRWSDPVDVVWIGQSLHHLRGAAKLAFMRQVRGILDGRGLFVIWEPTTHVGEDRNGWLRRFVSGTRPLWTDVTEGEWNAMVDHIAAADFPETAATWHSLGHAAGFTKVDDVFTAPTNLARVYCYRA
jgi:SAM-dependent methyltransferase